MLDTKHVLVELHALNCPPAALAELAGLKEPPVVGWLEGTGKLTKAAQFRISEVLNALLQLGVKEGRQPDFTDIGTLRPAVERFRVILAPEDTKLLTDAIAKAGEATVIEKRATTPES